MKCPHCEYKNGWVGEDNVTHNGKEGDFFVLSNNIHMDRKENYYSENSREVYGCPKCGKIFFNPMGW